VGQGMEPTTSIAAAKLADDYELARKSTDGGPKRTEKPQGPRQCFTCRKTGHLAQECPKPKTEISTPAMVKETKPPGPKTEKRTEWKCFNCREKEHISWRCPSNAALLCHTGRPAAGHMSREGVVEGHIVTDILLDTGSSQTVVRSDLVPAEKPSPFAVHMGTLYCILLLK